MNDKYFHEKQGVKQRMKMFPDICGGRQAMILQRRRSL